MTTQITSASAGTNPAQLVQAKPLLDGYIPQAQVAQELNMTKDSVRRAARDGRLPGRVKIGRRVYFHRDTLLKWFQSRMEAAADLNKKLAARSDAALYARNRKAVSK